MFLFLALWAWTTRFSLHGNLSCTLWPMPNPLPACHVSPPAWILGPAPPLYGIQRGGKRERKRTKTFPPLTLAIRTLVLVAR